jgi:hypothetical protein
MLEEKTNGAVPPFLVKRLIRAPNRQAEALPGRAIARVGKRG